MTVDTGPVVFPMPRDSRCPLNPSPEYSRLREESPLARVTTWAGGEAWLITRYADTRAFLGEPTVSNDRSHPAYPHYTEAAQVVTRGFMSHLAPAEHIAMRRRIMPEFSVRRMEELRPRVQQIVDDLIDGLIEAGDHADLLESFALPATTLMICTLLGVPYEDRELFHESVAVGFRADTTLEESTAASAAFVEYLDELVSRRESDPGDDMLSRLAAEHVNTGLISHDDLVNLAKFLVIAGFETTASTLVLGVCALLEHPAQLAAMVEDPTLVPDAVEEVLRYTAVTQSGRRRVTTQEIEVGGQIIPACTGVIAAPDSANRDPEAFPDPDVFDIRRKARHHVSFGYGVHACAGSSLARVELQVALETLFRRIPTLRLSVPLTELSFKHDSQIYGLYELPVAW